MSHPIQFNKQHDTQSRYEYLKSQLSKLDHLNLINRLIQEIKHNESQQIRIFQLENNFNIISQERAYLIDLIEQKNNEKIKLLEVQQNICKQLQLQLKIKNSQQIIYEAKYQQLISQLKNEANYLKDLQIKMNQNTVFNQKLMKLEEKNRNLQELAKQLQTENINLQHFSKKYSEEYKKIRQQFKQLETKLINTNEQLREKNQRLHYLQGNLNSLNKIQTLNQIPKNLNIQEIEHYQKLQKSYNVVRSQNQQAFKMLSETNKILSQSQIQRKKLKEQNQILKKLYQKLQIQIQELKSKQSKVSYNSKNNQIQQLKKELKRLEIQIQQNYNYFKRQSDGNNKITEQLGKYKKQLESKNSLDEIYKSKQSRISRNSNISSPKKLAVNNSLIQEQQWSKVTVTSKSLEQSTNNLRKIIKNIARKVNELTQPPKVLLQ